MICLRWARLVLRPRLLPGSGADRSAAAFVLIMSERDLQVTYVAPMSGEYKVTLAVGTVTVAGSPFRVPCQQPRPSEHETTVDLRNGHGFVGEPYSAAVTVRDQFGQPYVRPARRTAQQLQGPVTNSSDPLHERLGSLQEQNQHDMLCPGLMQISRAAQSDGQRGGHQVRWADGAACCRCG